MVFFVFPEFAEEMENNFLNNNLRKYIKCHFMSFGYRRLETLKFFFSSN